MTLSQVSLSISDENDNPVFDEAVYNVTAGELH